MAELTLLNNLIPKLNLPRWRDDPQSLVEKMLDPFEIRELERRRMGSG